MGNVRVTTAGGYVELSGQAVRVTAVGAYVELDDPFPGARVTAVGAYVELDGIGVRVTSIGAYAELDARFPEPANPAISPVLMPACILPPVGPSVLIYAPLIAGGAFLSRAERPEGYTHSVQAEGGYWSARFALAGGIGDADEWLEDGLLRHIVTYDDALGRCWEGFVNSIDVAYGPLTVKRGPVLDIANRVDLYYSTVDNSTIPPTVGLRANAGLANDTVSQARYGIRTRILSSGGCVPADALVIRDTYLAERAWPVVSKQWRTGAGSPPKITLNCLGYCHWLDYPYNQTAATGSITTAAKILAVLAANPNIAWLAFDTSGVEAPASPANVDAWENDNNPGWDLIMDAVSRGDATNARWLFGIYDGLAAVYAARTSVVEYHQALSDPAQRVTTPAGQEVPPWNVLPGKWLLFPDLLVGSGPPAALDEDPRTMFIESVVYSAPRGLQLAGGRLGKLSQIIAQMGLAGVGG